MKFTVTGNLFQSFIIQECCKTKDGVKTSCPACYLRLLHISLTIMEITK